MAVVGRGGAERLEVFTALAVGGEIAGPRAGVLAGDLSELIQIGGKALEIGIDHRIRTISRHDPAVPAAVADRLVPAQIVECAFRGGDDLDVEALEERARPVFRLAE